MRLKGWVKDMRPLVVLIAVLSAASAAWAAPVSISDAKLLSDGQSVELRAKRVTAVFADGCAYVEEADRSAGILFAAGSVSVRVGDLVDIVGTMYTRKAAEGYPAQREITEATVSLVVNPSPPATPVRLIFIHHSCGSNWLANSNGGVGVALRDANYYVSDTNYGWGPSGIGNSTDIGHWWTWFRGPSSPTYMAALYAETGQTLTYSRLPTSPGGPNEIVMFKSCYPNSSLRGNIADPIPPIATNPLKGQSSGSSYHTVANAKGIYIDLLEYFAAHQEKLFVVITAPPLRSATYAANARHFNNWLVNDWLDSYPHSNVAVFDFYNVLTTNGGSANVNDLGLATGNHHRFYNAAIQHKTDGDDDADPNVLEYPTGDDHPSQAGNLKATGEYVKMLNIAYHRWKAD